VSPGGEYAGARVVCATKHGKERYIDGPFRAVLGASVFGVEGLDTDRFGTFSGEIPRVLSPTEAARAKIVEAFEISDALSGLATEGSFTADWGVLIEHHELMMFIDRERGIELVEQVVRPLALPTGRSVTGVDEALHYGQRLGFPEQGVVLRGAQGVQKDLSDEAALAREVAVAIEADGSVTLEPDFRAHRCPQRNLAIALLAERMANRLATHCPACRAPGFGSVRSERGMPCGMCQRPTGVIAADIWGCAVCERTDRRAIDMRQADPRWCGSCNP
jgi:hypothetical protein